MKKISTLLLAAASVALSANAALPEPEDLTSLITNPSFEEEFTGWTVEGSLKEAEAWTFDNVTAWPEDWSKNNIDGDYIVRMTNEANSVSYEKGECIYQEIESDKMGGTYVLSMAGLFSRDSMRGHSSMPGQWWSYMFIADEDVSEPQYQAGFESISKFAGNGWGADALRRTEGWAYADYAPSYVDADGNVQKGGLGKFYAIVTTESEFLTIGWATPRADETWNKSAWDMTKADIMLDNFKLEWYDTDDTEAVKQHIQERIAAETGAEVSGIVEITTPTTKADNKYYNLQGIEIAKPTAAGLYIHNGKKFIVK